MGRNHLWTALSARVNKRDRNDACGIAHMMRVGLYRPVHVKTLASQKRYRGPWPRCRPQPLASYVKYELVRTYVGVVAEVEVPGVISAGLANCTPVREFCRKVRAPLSAISSTQNATASALSWV
jgi:hypothetical protein